MRREDVELLAPAGTWEALEAAVFAGADAVYLGGSAFGRLGPMPKILALKNCSGPSLLRHLQSAFVSMSRSIPLSLMEENEGRWGDYVTFLSNIGVGWHYCPGSWHHPALPPHGT